MKWSVGKPTDGFASKEKNPVWFIWAHISSFDLLAYEKDNQHQDEAEDDPENGHELQEQGPQEADPESEADVSVLSSIHDTWEVKRRKGNMNVSLTRCLRLQICLLFPQHRRTVACIIIVNYKPWHVYMMRVG